MSHVRVMHDDDVHITRMNLRCVFYFVMKTALWRMHEVPWIKKTLKEVNIYICCLY